MKFGYTIVYVQNVKASLAFFERAFGLKTSFLDEAAGEVGDRPRFKPVSKNENLGPSLIFHAIAI